MKHWFFHSTWHIWKHLYYFIDPKLEKFIEFLLFQHGVSFLSKKLSKTCIRSLIKALLTDNFFCTFFPCSQSSSLSILIDYTGLQGFVVEKLWVVSGVIFDAESESGIRISLLRQDFEIFEVRCDFFSQTYGHIKFWHLSEQPYEHSHWLFGAYHSAFENLSWKFVLVAFDGL